MAKKIRVYELARELGLSNKECLDLCESLGVGVKSHSSSMEEAHADRVRRKAEREGLIREVVEEEPEPEEAPAAPAKPVVSSKRPPPPRRPAPSEAPAADAAAPAATEPTPPPPPPAAPKRVVTSSGSSGPIRVPETPPAATEPPPAPAAPASPPQPPPVAAETPAPAAAPAPAPKVEPAPSEAPVVATPAAAKAEPVAADATPAAADAPAAAASAAAPAAEAKAGVPAAEAKAGVPAAAAPAGAKPTTPPMSPSGKPIPPPPAPRSLTGKPIPPPPGRGGRAAPERSGGGGRARPSGGPRPSGGGGPSRPAGGGGPGRPQGSRPGVGRGPQRGPRRRKSRRRRRNLEELQPVDVPTYSPENAAVPEGLVVIERHSTPQELGVKLNRTAADVVRFLLMNGEMITATQTLSDEMIELFAEDIGATIRLVDLGEEQEEEMKVLLEVPDTEGDDDAVSRPPVITVMGHVDHGKTKLLDQIRNANVVDGEAGGITQHIGAYQVERDGHHITFIDTPGHEAFTAIRARGAQATDIVILVVAADDGVMPQTVEAINHAKAADVPIVVAVNKIDRENANPDRVLTQLSEHDLVPEEWGGDTIVAKISALENIGIDELLDQLLVVAELEDLKAVPDGRAVGVVLESHLDVGRGPVSTVLVQGGTLSVGDPMIAGAAWGRVRAIVTDTGEQVKTAGPSTPVEILGLSDVSRSGDEFVVAKNEKVASKVASTREHWQRVSGLGRDAGSGTGARLEDLFKNIQSGQKVTLNLIVKADVQGSLEALTDSLRKLDRPDVDLSFVLTGVGGLTENDIQLAAASDATIIGFNVRPDRKARDLAQAEDVEIRNYEIIYKVLEDIEAAMLGMLEPVFEEIVTGEAQVRELFRVKGIGAIAGCFVENGTIRMGDKVRFLREGTIIWKGTIQSLKRFQDDVAEVRNGLECGIGLSDFQDLKQGDIIETFEEKEIPHT